MSKYTLESFQEDNEKHVIRAYKNIFSKDDGKMVLEDLKDNFCVEPFIYGGDNHKMDCFYREGLRLAYCYIAGKIKADIDDE